MIRIGIVGYGNLAKGAECAIAQNKDMELVTVFTRRDPAKLSVKTPGAAVCAMMIIGGQPMWLAILAAIIVGMLTGLVTGIFHVFMGK